MCYTYDNLSRVTARTIKKLSDNSVVSTETFNYDAAGNVTSAPDSSFQYDTNNRLISFNGNTVSYDLDGNMLSNGTLTCTYDSANRLVSAGGHTYTYDAENVRIRNLCVGEDTTYTYDCHTRLSRLLCKTTSGVVTKYVYGSGLIGEDTNNTFKTYHFDSRGSTVAITDASGNITDTFAYDTYGKLLTRTGTNKVIFGYNGRDGVVTDDNGLIYMRARYYSYEMRRFINADVIAGKLSNAITLNRYAYANDNPAMNVDPTGLLVGALIVGGLLLGGLLIGLTGCSSKDESTSSNNQSSQNRQSKTEPAPAPEQPTTSKITSVEQARALYLSGQISLEDIPPQYSWEPSIRAQYVEEQKKQQEIVAEQKKAQKSDYETASKIISATGYATDILSPVGQKAMENAIRNSPRPNNIGKGTWAKQVDADVVSMNKAFDYAGYGVTSVFTILNTGMGIEENIQNGESTGEIISDAAIDIGSGAVSITTTILLAKAGTAISPGWGTVIGLGVGLIYDFFVDPLLDAAFE